ncbi:MAG TPA: hypothetical protein VLM85_27530 [Polyangiaceae bacterium]|nr:hypothetical protein [Polyangiaceae bacterium]
MKGGFVAVVGVVLSIAAPALADAAKRDPAQEAALDGALRAVSPQSVETFHAANEAMDRSDYAAAATAYRKVHEAAPAFVAGTRRLCVAEARSGDAEVAVRHCREALAAEGSPENHAALAIALLTLGTTEHGVLKEAKKEAGEAAKLAPEAEFSQLTLCQVAYEVGDLEAVDQCSRKLSEIEPDAATTHLFAAVDRFGHQDLAAARGELEQAKAKGIDPKLSAALLGRIEATEKLLAPTPLQRVLRGVELLLAGWLAALVLLFGAGGVLSVRFERSRQAGPAARRVYSAVVTLATIYFYVTLAVLVVAVAAAVGGFAYSAYPLGQSTFVRAIAVGSVLVYAALAIARAATTSGDDEPLGPALELDEEPKLRALLDEAASAVGTRPVDEVYVAPGASLEIVDRGGALAHLRGRGERALVLGIEWLGKRKLRSLRERLATEYGRWRRDGAAGGSVALAMRRALRLGLEENESALNPARWLLRGWSGFYDRVSRGAVSEQERLAGRWAEKAYGAEADERGDDDAAGRTLVADPSAVAAMLQKKKPVVAAKVKRKATIAREEDEDEVD